MPLRREKPCRKAALFVGLAKRDFQCEQLRRDEDDVVRAQEAFMLRPIACSRNRSYGVSDSRLRFKMNHGAPVTRRYKIRMQSRYAASS
jgi:hypothetical protein